MRVAIKHNRRPNSVFEQNDITVEAILESLGGFSWFQLWACVVTISPEISAAMVFLSPVLTGSNQFCRNASNLGCTDSGFPGQFKSVVQEWNLFGPNVWISDLFTSLQMLGALFGAILSGQFAERYGRKLAHFTLCFIMGLFGFASGWAPDPYSFCILRFFAGFAVGGCYVVYLNYLMEFLTPSWRTVCGCVSLWSFGEMLLALAGYLLPGWRHLEWATSLPTFLIFLAYPWMPESPRWLLCRGRTQEALEVFNQIAKWNNRPAPAPSDIEILQRQFSLDSDSSLAKCCPSFSIFHYKQYRSQLLILIFSWFAFQLIYYGISFNMKNLSGDLYLNLFYMGVVGFPGSFVGLLFNNRFGRRKTIVGLSMATFVFLLIVILIEEGTKLSHNYPLIIVFLCLSVRLFIAAGFAVLSCFTAESFPTVVRVSCMGICALAGNLGGILAPQLVYISTIVSSAQYVAFGLLSIAIIFGAFNLREITGLPLADFLKKDDNVSKIKSRTQAVL